MPSRLTRSSIVHRRELQLNHVCQRPHSQRKESAWGPIDGVRDRAVLSISLVVACCTCLANGQATPQEEHATNASGDSSQALHAIDQLVDQNRRLEQQNRELMDQIDSLRRTLSTEAGKVTETVQDKGPTKTASTTTDTQQADETSAASTFAAQEEPYKWGRYTPNYGYKSC